MIKYGSLFHNLSWSADMPYKSQSYYRPASAHGGIIEDALCANDAAGMYAVCDGVSGPYSPSNPKTMYGYLTGGQMVGSLINTVLHPATAKQNIEELLMMANTMVGIWHVWQKKDPLKEAVAGACVAACQVGSDVAKLVLVGDCFAFWGNNEGLCSSLTNFDQAVIDFEKKADTMFRKCVNVVDEKFPKTKGKNIDNAWDEYFPYFSQKQFFRANRNLGSGGHAMLNGDSAVAECWTAVTIPLKDLSWLMLCTDGLLPPHLMDYQHHSALIKGVKFAYEEGGFPGLCSWRDDCVAEHEANVGNSDMPHIEGHPEGSMIYLNFSA